MTEIPVSKSGDCLGDAIPNAPYPIIKIRRLEYCALIIVLMDPNENRAAARFQNLVAYDAQGTLLWKVSLPTTSGPDCFTEFDVSKDQLTAFSFSCYRCEVDLKDGSLITKAFVK